MLNGRFFGRRHKKFLGYIIDRKIFEEHPAEPIMDKKAFLAPFFSKIRQRTITMSITPFCLFTPPRKGKRVVWEITSQCNMRCRHCCSNASDFRTNSLKNPLFSNRKLLEKRVDKMVSFGIKEFYISGGEPFMVKNILDFLKFLKEKGVKVGVASNGACLDENTIKRLSEIKIDFLHISLDGHLPKIHNYLRGGNFFNKTVKKIKIIKEHKIPLRIGCIIWRKNENHIEKMVELCIRLKAEELRLGRLIGVGRFIDNPQLYPKRSWPAIVKEIKNIKRKHQDKIKITVHRMSDSGSPSSQLCPAGNRIFFLNSRGELSPCSWIAKNNSEFSTTDSLVKKNIKILAKSKEFLEFRKMLRKRRDKKFRGCPFAAKHQNGSYFSNDNLLK